MHFLVIAVIPVNKSTGNGWKNNFTLCIEDKGEVFVKCIEQITYSKTDIFVDYFKGLPVFGDTNAPIIQTIKVDSGKITSDLSDGEPTIELTATLFYYIFMLDPMATFFTDSPQILPQTMLSLKANHLLVFIKVVY